MIGCIGYIGFKLYKRFNSQANQISDMRGQIEYLDAKLTQTTDYYNFQTEYSDNTYNYFAIGNSLTLITSWGRGICSSEPDNDYFHLVLKKLEAKHGNVVAYPYNFSTWEHLRVRDKAFNLIDPFLSNKLNLVTIQLGENSTDLTTYEKDLEKLIQYVKEKAPEATILVIGDWWSMKKNEMRKEAVKNSNVLFADLSEVIGNKTYQSQTGKKCRLNDGSFIEVSERASTHPGDEGMQYIADKVAAALELR